MSRWSLGRKLYSMSLGHQLYSTMPKPSMPGPIPLGNRQQQKEFEELVRKQEQLNKEAEASQAAQEAAAKYDKSLSNSASMKHPDGFKEVPEPWKDNINPHTGEVGGPKGKEPTRYGDWERNGRVYDF